MGESAPERLEMRSAPPRERLSPPSEIESVRPANSSCDFQKLSFNGSFVLMVTRNKYPRWFNESRGERLHITQANLLAYVKCERALKECLLLLMSLCLNVGVSSSEDNSRSKLLSKVISSSSSDNILKSSDKNTNQFERCTVEMSVSNQVEGDEI